MSIIYLDTDGASSIMGAHHGVESGAPVAAGGEDKQQWHQCLESNGGKVVELQN